MQHLSSFLLSVDSNPMRFVWFVCHFYWKEKQLFPNVSGRSKKKEKKRSNNKIPHWSTVHNPLCWNCEAAVRMHSKHSQRERTGQWTVTHMRLVVVVPLILQLEGTWGSSSRLRREKQLTRCSQDTLRVLYEINTVHYLVVWAGHWENVTFELSSQLSHRRLGWRILLKKKNGWKFQKRYSIFIHLRKRKRHRVHTETLSWMDFIHSNFKAWWQFHN